MRLLDVGLAVPEQACLRIMIAKRIASGAYFVCFDSLMMTFKPAVLRSRRSLLWPTVIYRVGLVRSLVGIDGLPVHAIALIIMERAD